MSVLTVDLGTSNTVAVLSAHGQPPRVVEIDGATMMPSAVFAADGGTLVVGKEAERRARTDPARYEPNPKRRVDEGTLLLGDTVVPVTDAFAAVLRRIAVEVQRQLGGAAPEEVRLTHPAQWGPVRRNVLLSAARQAGLGQNLVLVPEPVAAAAHFASFQELAQGQALAVYDLGAGTFDVAVVGATQQGFVVLAEAGLADLGGLDVDQALLDHVGRQVMAKDPARWQRVLRPESTVDRRAQRALREDVRAGKESLSTHPQTEIALPEPFEDILVTRAELEELITAGLLRSVELVASTIRSVGLSPDRLAGIFLVGGSSRIPLVAMLIARHLGVLPVNLDQPESAVARGALHVSKDGVSLRTGAVTPGQQVQQPVAQVQPAAQAVAPQAFAGQQPISQPLPQQIPQQAPPQAFGQPQQALVQQVPQAVAPQAFAGQQAVSQPVPAQQMVPQAFGQPQQPQPGQQPMPMVQQPVAQQGFPGSAPPPSGVGWHQQAWPQGVGMPTRPRQVASARPTVLFVFTYIAAALSLVFPFWPTMLAGAVMIFGAIWFRKGKGSLFILVGSAITTVFVALDFGAPWINRGFGWWLHDVSTIPSRFFLPKGVDFYSLIAAGVLSLVVLILSIVWRARRPRG